MKSFLFLSIVKHDVETTGQSHDKFLIIHVRMTATVLSTWNVINPIGTFYLERYIFILLNNRKVSPIVEHFLQLNNPYSFHVNPQILIQNAYRWQ